MIKLGDVVSVLREYPDNTFDGVLCDPPYGLSFMGKRWDYDVPSVDLWREVLRVCKPGASLLAAFGSRTYHRGVVRIEDAGWEIRDSIVWMYGSGFPKSLDVSKAIDKVRDDREDILRVTAFVREARDRAGSSNAKIDEAFGTHGMAEHWTSSKSQPAVPTWDQWVALRGLLCFDDEMDAEVWRLNGRKGEPGEAWKDAEVVGEHEGALPGLAGERFGARETSIKAPNTDAARLWSGYGTALKPAHEPYVLARKPLDGTVAQNVARWGVGALAIDACRIGDEGRAEEGKTVAGRWPANVILDEAAGAALDEQTGITSSSDRPRFNSGTDSVARGKHKPHVGVGYSDSGGASRFFYCAKASRAERDAGCEDLPAKTRAEATGRDEDTAGAKNPRAGAGSIGGSRNHHPTVKPLALCEYLARLILPPKPGVLLVPFAGSGSEVVGALRAGWPEVVGIEREAEYVEIARRRVAHALATPAPKPKQAKSAKPRRPRAPKTNPKPLVVVRRLEQIPLFP